MAGNTLALIGLFETLFSIISPYGPLIVEKEAHEEFSQSAAVIHAPESVSLRDSDVQELPDENDSQVSQCSEVSLESNVANCSLTDLADRSQEVPSSFQEAVVLTKLSAKEIRLLRRKALVANLPPPNPTLANEDEDIDLATEEDKRDPELEAFISRLAPSRKKNMEKRTSTSPRGADQSGMHKFERVKQKLKVSMKVRREKGHARRMELFRADNERWQESEDDIEDDETEEEKEKKRLQKRERIMKKMAEEGSDADNSDNDSDYKEGEEGAASGSDASRSPVRGVYNDEEGSGISEIDENEIEDSPVVQDDLDDLGLDFMDSDATVSVSRKLGNIDERDELIASKQSQSASDEKGMHMDDDDPPTLTQFFGADSQPTTSEFAIPGMVDAGLGTNDGDDELMMLCSGRFPPSLPPVRVPVPGPSSSSTQVHKINSDDETEPSDAKVHKSKKVMVASDDEDEEERRLLENTDNLAVEELEMETHGDDNEVETVDDTEPLAHRKRVVLDDSDEELQMGKGATESGEENQSDNDPEEELVEEEESEPSPSPPPSSDEEEDEELAEFKRLEKKQYKQLLKREGFVDEQAELSGDDVGSDDEEFPEDNEYEAELADNETFDMDEVRRQNHRLMLKQQMDADHVDVLRMQDELFVDGDLMGSETDRKFRITVREEQDAAIEEEGMEENADGDEEDAEADASHLERIKAIKFRLEQAEQQELSQPLLEDENDFAANLFTSIGEIRSKTTVKGRLVPSLLGNKENLAMPVKEGGMSNVKQLYVRKEREETNGGGSSISGGTKRPPTDMDSCEGRGVTRQAKKRKPSVFRALE